MSNQHIQDEAASGRKFFTTLLNIADEDLNPYQYRLYGHYVRVAGESGACYESVRTTAGITQMSAAMVVKTRNELTNMGYIHCVKSDDQNDTIAVTVVDRWAENITRCSEKRSPHKHGVHDINTPDTTGVHPMNTGVHQESHKKNYKKKNTDKEEKLSAPALQDAVESPASKEKKQRPANPLFDIIAERFFKAKPGDAVAVSKVAGRVGKLLSFVQARPAGTVHGIAVYLAWYARVHSDRSLPLDDVKFATSWLEFEDSTDGRSLIPVPPAAVPAPEITPQAPFLPEMKAPDWLQSVMDETAAAGGNPLEAAIAALAARKSKNVRVKA